MFKKISTLLLTASSVIVLTACSGASESRVDKTAEAPIDSLTQVELDKVAMKAAEAGSEVNAPYNEFLAKYVAEKDGIHLVAYNKVSDADEKKLEGYIQTLSNTDISGFTDKQAMAYWFNLYNAETVNLILDNYPLGSIKTDIKKPWDTKRLTVNGKEMSLNNIEHDTVRAMYDEPRVHFAFNCASIGCPNLKMTAWEADTLDADLTKGAMDYLGSPRGITVKENGDLQMSELFKWYGDDFGPDKKAVLTYLSKYAPADKKSVLMSKDKVDKWVYDWSLNEAKDPNAAK